jgi:hypothetical protein
MVALVLLGRRLRRLPALLLGRLRVGLMRRRPMLGL